MHFPQENKVFQRPGRITIRHENITYPKKSFSNYFPITRRRANREVQTVNWKAGKEGAAETGVKSSLKKAHKPWIRGKKGAQTVN